MSTPRTLSTLTPDDAYYYFGVARSFASGLGSTYDGVTPTNGYQPLWMLICSGVAALTRVNVAQPESWPLLPRCVITLQLQLGVLAIAMLARAAAKASASRVGYVAVWLGACNPWVVYSMCDGMEGGLVLFALSLLLWIGIELRALGAPSPFVQLSFGAALALACLARLDCALLVPIAGWLSWRLGASRVGVAPRCLRVIRITLPSVVVLAVYMCINATFFDTLVPISVWIKDSFPALAGRARALLFQYPLQFGLAAITCVAARSLHRRELLVPEHEACVLLGAGFVVLHATHTLLFMRGDVWKWHFASYWPFSLFILALFAAQRSAALKPVVVSLASGVVLLAQAAGEWVYLDHREDRAFMIAVYDAAAEARRLLPQAALGAMSDCGVFGYYRGGRVLNLDGLVLDAAYQHTLARDGLAAYLRSRHASFLAVRYEDSSGPRPGYGQQEYRQHSMVSGLTAPMLLFERDEIIRIRQTDVHQHALRVVVIWRTTSQNRPR